MDCEVECQVPVFSFSREDVALDFDGKVDMTDSPLVPTFYGVMEVASTEIAAATETAAAMVIDSNLCPVCAETMTAPESLCGNPECTPMCSTCITACLKSAVGEMALVASKVRCPGVCRTFLRFDQWAVTENRERLDLVETYGNLMQATQRIRCPNCHSNTPLVNEDYVSDTFTTTENLRLTFNTSNRFRSDVLFFFYFFFFFLPRRSRVFGENSVVGTFDQFLSELRAFERCETSDADFCDGLNKLCLVIRNNGEMKTEDGFVWAADSFLFKVCAIVKCPERRSMILRRAIAVEGHLETSCCNAVVCFRCASSQTHIGSPCESAEEIENLGDTAFNTCPVCCMGIYKIDGCSWITCVCGAEFCIICGDENCMC